VNVAGETWQDTGVFLPVEQRRIGFVFQDASLFPHLTVRGNLEYGWKRRRNLPAATTFDHAVELLGIGPLLGHAPGKLSGGERQRVAIARALLGAPQWLLLDEPLASIDAARKREILPWLERLRDDLALPMIYVSHSIDEVARLADHVACIEGGRIVRSGPLADMIVPLSGVAEGEEDVGGIIDGKVAAYDAHYRLLQVAFSGGELRVAHAAVPIGRRIRIRVLAHDISLATVRPQQSSVLNLLRGTIAATTGAPDLSQVRVTLRIGDVTLVARITRLSWDRLGLAVGTGVWLQIKAAAIVS
jgi:molybdate transport system ATP-binding protein